MGSSQHNVTYYAVLVNRQVVSVGAALGVIFGPQNLSSYDELAIEVQNPDNSQTIDCYVDIGTATGGPFYTSTWNGLLQIGPNASQSALLDKTGQTVIRLIAKASGAGVANAVLTISGKSQRIQP